MTILNSQMDFSKFVIHGHTSTEKPEVRSGPTTGHSPEDLPRFFDALASGRGEFVNGVRFVYSMQGEAMRIINLVGNKLFSWAFSSFLGQEIRDPLYGTKAFWAKDYRHIAANRAEFADFDPFGDF